ncbi:hypothetical protein Bca52824_033114 [Brassica carinata]|uniref:Uncharacterized protein n=1 Tax=Brassica carinata TaxID=52824 RepID=A0A8X7SBU5_BRACI|nr:hypothetical protein Bca52824_033114 [Brassica carinata]
MTWKVRSIKEFWNIASVILVDKGLPTSEGCINLIVVAVEAQVVVTIANLYKRIISWELVAENCSQEVVNFLNVLAKISIVMLRSLTDPLVGDFELFKVIDSSRSNSSHSAVADTIGNTPPEYAYTMRVTMAGQKASGQQRKSVGQVGA